MDKNTILAFLLSGLVLIGFMWYNQPTQEQIEAHRRYRDSLINAQIDQQEREALEAAQQRAALIDEADSDSVRLAKSISRFGTFMSGGMQAASTVSLQNNLVSIDFSTKGAQVERVLLKEYSAYHQDTLELFAPGDASFSLELPLRDNRSVFTNEMVFSVKEKTDSSVVFSLLSAAGGSLDFIYHLPNDSYMLDFDVVCNGVDGDLMPVSELKSTWKMRMRQHEKGRKFESRYAQMYYYSADKGHDYLSESSNDTESVEYPLRWVAFKDQFFSGVLITDKGLFQNAQLKSTVEADSSEYLKDYEAVMSLPLCKEDGKALDLRFFFGPNHYKLLKSYDAGLSGDDKLNLKRIVPLGAAVIRWVNQLLTIPLFNFFSKFIDNFGIIILLLTLVVKLIIFPLTYKSYLSTAKMRVLKPQIDEINQRIPEDRPTERSQATMELYRKAGVNPAGGCLPMLLQMPVLVALFYFFPTAIELRGESFLWAQDLSTYDPIVSWDVQIPLVSYFFGNHISLFCLLMTVTNILYTKVNMRTTDTGQMNQMPMMKYMMYLMPVMFLFIFNDYASGLCYYYFVSLLITIIQTYVIRKFFVDETKLQKQIAENQTKPMKKSTWLARIEQMQKEQQQMLENQKRK